jgi:hypothetical protein
MRPIGLTTKPGRNKYASERDGELMLIHQCTVCPKVVINRIAESCDSSAAFQAKLETAGVSMLTAGDGDLVRRRLFGNKYC